MTGPKLQPSTRHAGDHRRGRTPGAVGLRSVALVAAALLCNGCQEPAPSQPAQVQAQAGDAAVPTLSLESFRWRFWGAQPCPEGTRAAQEYREDGVERWCERPDGTPHGTRTSWHRNGWRAWEVQERDGYRDGIEREWYESGHLRRQGEWRRSQQVGTQTWWNEAGQRTWVCRYEAGEEAACWDPRSEPSEAAPDPGQPAGGSSEPGPVRAPAGGGTP